MMTIFVRGVMAASSCAGVILKPALSVASMMIGFPPTSSTWSG